MGTVITLTTANAAPQSLTIADAVDQFLARDWSPNTLRSFRSDLRPFVETFAERHVDDLTPTELQTYLDTLTSRRKPVGRPLSAASRNRHHGSLSNLFGWLERQGEVEVNPMSKVEKAKLGERLPRPMNRKQIEQFFGGIKDLRDRTLFSLLYGSGVRISEALGINIEDLNLEDGTVRIVGKGNRERVAYTSDETSKLIRRYLRTRGRPRDGALFISREGRLTYSRTHQLFRRYAEGLDEESKRLTIHQLRHSFGSERAGQIDALVLRDLMGHKSLRTTQRYAQVNPDAARKAFQEFDRQRR